MNTKAIVKVMNFHSMLRVERSRKNAEKYMVLEKEISQMIDFIVNNRNIVLDKRFQAAPKNAPELNIYFASDFGFCASINSQIIQMLEEHNAGVIVTVGKKIHTKRDVILRISREEFSAEIGQLEVLLHDAVMNQTYSKVHLVYNRYENMSTILPIEQCIYPMELNIREKNLYPEDYSIEGDITDILLNLIETYLNYEVRIAAINSFASENVIRQSATKESLRRIDEKECEQAVLFHKKRNEKAFRKVVDAYVKMKSKEERIEGY